MKIILDKVSSNSFTGFVKWTEVTFNQRLALGLGQDNVKPLYVPVEGEFEVEWDYEIPMVQLGTLTLIGALNGKTYHGYIRTEKSMNESGMEFYRPVYGDVPARHEVTLDYELDSIRNVEELTSNIESAGYSDWQVDRLGSMIDDAMDRLAD